MKIDNLKNEFKYFIEENKKNRLEKNIGVIFDDNEDRVDDSENNWNGIVDENGLKGDCYE